MRFMPMKAGTYTISSGFGNRPGGFHRGLDFAAKDGTPIYAAQAGYVVHIGKADGFGQWIVIDHPADKGAGTTVYGHMWDAFATGLKKGDWVYAGQHIGFVGSNGQSTGPHLHFEVHPYVWKQGSQVDPKPWLKDAAEPHVPVSNGAPTEFTENNVIENWRGKPYGNSQSRNGQKPRFLVLHTSEGAGGAGLLDYMQRNQVSYHDVIDDTGVNKATIWHLVDKSRAAWSVGNANNYTINYCFGTSFAHKHTRADWLTKQDDSIRALAWQVALDCHRFNIEPVLRVGKSASGYATLKQPGVTGITDHNGINVLAGGDHTDVGPYFPWDVFIALVQKYYAGEEDDMFNSQDREMLKRVYHELTEKWESRSIYRTPGEGKVDTLVGFSLNQDGMTHAEMVERLAVLGDEDSLKRVQRTAEGKGAVKDKATVERAKKVLAKATEGVGD